jgi:hypothetical protein
MLRRVALVRTDVSEELSATFIRVTRIGELETMLAVTSNRRTLRRNTWYFSKGQMGAQSPRRRGADGCRLYVKQLRAVSECGSYTELSENSQISPSRVMRRLLKTDKKQITSSPGPYPVNCHIFSIGLCHIIVLKWDPILDQYLDCCVYRMWKLMYNLYTYS